MELMAPMARFGFVTSSTKAATRVCRHNDDFRIDVDVGDSMEKCAREENGEGDLAHDWTALSGLCPRAVARRGRSIQSELSRRPNRVSTESRPP